MTPQSSNRVSTFLGNSGLCWTIFAWNRDTVVPAEGNGDLQTLICVLVARPRRYLTLSNHVPWQNSMAAYLGYTLRMKTLFRGWPVMVHDTHTRRRSFITFSFAHVTSFHYLLSRFLCCHLVVVTFVLLVPAKWLVRKTSFCTSQMIGWEDHLWNDPWCVKCDVKPLCIIS